jgi:diguanylate cyclase (GGDEF)-like protein
MAGAMRDNTGNLERAVSERTRQLEQIAFVDPLTGIANRRGFAQEYERVMEAARRTRELPGILLVDIDRFKQINDRFGHKAGDDIVTEFARRISAVLRPDDLCGRWGGDEFIVLFADCNGSLLRRLGDRVLEAIRADEFGDAWERTLPVTPSIGAHLVRPGETLDAATHKADLALYAAKDQGRNRLVMYEPTLQAMAKGGSRVA